MAEKFTGAGQLLLRRRGANVNSFAIQLYLHLRPITHNASHAHVICRVKYFFYLGK